MASRGLRSVQGFLQFCVATVEAVLRDALPLRASALTYYTILAVIPVLAFVLAIMQAVGINAELIVKLVAYATQVAPEAGDWINETVQKVNFASLGTIGAALVFLTTVLGISSIESTLNGIWGVTRSRSWERRIPDYLAVLIVTPLFLGVALSLGATLQSQTLVAQLREYRAFELIFTTGLRFAPLVLLCLGLTFLYWFLPNTRVKFSSSLLGGAAAALLLAATQAIYVQFNIGASRANALYGGLAAFPLFLAFVYISWLIVLLGAEIGAVWENLVQMRRARRGNDPDPAAREALGLAIAVRAARSFDRGENPLTAEALADELELPIRSIRSILDTLQRAGVFALSGEEEIRGAGYQLGRAADRLPVRAILTAMRGERDPGPPLLEISPAVAELLLRVDARAEEAIGDATLADLARWRGAAETS
jgi:membrane protein